MLITQYKGSYAYVNRREMQAMAASTATAAAAAAGLQSPLGHGRTEGNVSKRMPLKPLSFRSLHSAMVVHRIRLELGAPKLAVLAASALPSVESSDSKEATEASEPTAEPKPHVAPRRKRPGESKGFVEEMRFVAMRLHTKDQAKDGEKEADVQPVGSWKPTTEGYLKFLVDSKLVYDTLESIVEKAAHPSYAEFKNTGLERSAALAKDLEWFKSQGHEIPESGIDGKSYAEYLVYISEQDPPAFICHFYNVYFAHTAGGRFIGKKVAETILDGKELEFYKYEGDLPQLLASVKEKLNRVAQEWSREDKDRCLKETEKSFQYSGKILRLIIS